MIVVGCFYFQYLRREYKYLSKTHATYFCSNRIPLLSKKHEAIHSKKKTKYHFNIIFIIVTSLNSSFIVTVYGLRVKYVLWGIIIMNLKRFAFNSVFPFSKIHCPQNLNSFNQAHTPCSERPRQRFSGKMDPCFPKPGLCPRLYGTCPSFGK